ncbi:elongation factor Ts [Rhodoligotrophos appendicifer]|uniref:translation elongation factor Ts n=1 Tax=Rhodoligotrophos appendicifer TaxID=987056 RepID=UPI0011861037|nr:translation elongation factor Ts [Rhodoligotrophos appendicifer]
MAEITASMVKELRESTGAGMMDCKSALAENDGDMDAAIDWLRKKGLSKAAKKSSRVAAEGLIGVSSKGLKGAIVEVNSETDFVARNERFQAMVSEIADLALVARGDVDALKAASMSDGKSVADYVTEAVATIGENMNVRRTGYVEVSDGIVATYVHSQVVPGLGKIGVLVGLESGGDKAKLAAHGRQLAMHIAAASPIAVNPQDVDSSLVERERDVLAAQARESGKAEEIIAKMIEGRLRKYYEEVVLLHQVYVIDGENTVGKAIKEMEKDVGAPITVAAFVRFAIGEGIEREAGDFASEVAAAAGA